MAIPEIILREIIDASTPEGSNLPYVKAKYLMIGMSVDLSEYFVKLKAEIEDTFVAPDLIDAAELDRIISVATDEWLDITSVVADTVNKTITIDTDNPAVPPLRLPEDRCVMVLVGDDASKSSYTVSSPTFADFLDDARTDNTDDAITLYNFVYSDAKALTPRSFLRAVQCWDNLDNWLIAHSAPERVITAAASVWRDYEEL